jgi:proteasome lid subunit RPN8/RPN11
VIFESGTRARIGQRALDAIVAHAREAAPAECCGLLLGGNCSIAEAIRTTNIADEPRARFLIDPVDHINGRRAARGRGLDVVGFYHSHPASPALPSHADLEEANYPGHLYAIVSLAGDEPEVRLFQLTAEPGRTFFPVPFDIGG